MLLPEHCSIRENGKDCQLPPEFIISIKVREEEYMVGLACDKHKQPFYKKLQNLQKEGKVPNGIIQFSGLKAVVTNCIRLDPDGLIEL